jgi:ABC-type antimicrobial peptide transport system permease subunit
VGDLAPEIPLADIATGEELIDEALATPRSFLWLLGGFALSAVLLSLFGIYGVMVFFVQQQRREIGVRMALGGSPRSTFAMVLARGMRPVLLGTAIGLATALALGRLLAGLLYGVSARDPLTLGLTTALLLVVATATCLAPARRAARLDPATMLREE